MNSVWLFDFLKKGSIESFFNTYHKALLQGDPNMNPKKWFYVTEGKDDTLNLDVLEKTARKLLVDIREGNEVHERLIPAWDNRYDRHLNIIFAGDIEDEYTQKHLLDFAAKLINNRDYFPQASVRFYALLWRSTACTGDASVHQETFDFIRKLDEMMKLDINHRFHKVLFYESSIVHEEKEKALATMALSALHVAVHQSDDPTDELRLSDRNIYYNAGEAGAFYERDVHKEQETFFLSNILLDTLVNGDGTIDSQGATAFLDRQGVFFDKFQAESIAESLKAQCPVLPSDKKTYDVESEVSPFSLNFKMVWKKYFNGYVVNLKRNLINKTKQVIAEYTHNYKETLFAKQADFANAIKVDIENKVFEIFKNPQEHSVVSLPQAVEILDKMKKRIDNIAKQSDEARIEAFVFPEYLKGAREQVEAEIHANDPREVMSVLEGKLRKHPVYFLSMIVRAFVLGALLCYTGVTFFMDNASLPVTWGGGFVLFLLPFLLSFWSFREYIVRINSLKDQYTAAVLLKCQKELTDDIKVCIDKTYSDIDLIIEWIREQKLKYLQNNLAAVFPPEFSFTSSARFQPLLTCLPYSNGNSGKLLIPASVIDSRSESDLSGSFGRFPILDNPPVSTVSIRGDKYTFDQILHSNLPLRQDLLKDLLKTITKAGGNIEKNVKFEAIRADRTKLLLLDVSGSMSENDMKELKSAVSSLAATATIKWIAFNDSVVSVGDTSDEFQKISSGGGTRYIPAIQKAKEIIGSMFVDQVILISDGMPFESLEDIINASEQLNMPLHTISIGTSGASVMKEISARTSGEQIIVDDIKDLTVNLESKFNLIFSVGIRGDYNFGELMQKCYIPGCAEALHKYASEKMNSSITSLVDLVLQCANADGLNEWKDASYPTCTHDTAKAARLRELKSYIHVVFDNDIRQQLDSSKFTQAFSNRLLCNAGSIPEIMISVLSLYPLNGISDLKWGTPANGTR